MASTSRKIHSRRRLAALTFLSNISLDGTHRDTNLYNLNFNLHYNQTANNQSVSVKHIENCVSRKFSKSADTGPLEKSKKTKNFVILQSFDYAKKQCLKESEDTVNGALYRCDENQQSKSRDRVQKFVSDAKARLCNLSQKRKQMPHQKSIESYGLPSGKSTESLGGCRSRKPSLCPSECSGPSVVEIKFIKNLNDHKNDAERMVIVSEKKSPFILFSVLPYSKSSKGESKLDGSRRRHASSRQLSIINDGPDPLDLLILLGVQKPKEGQDISYGELLSPSCVHRRSKNCVDSWGEMDLRFPYHIHPKDYGTRKLSSTPPKNLEKEDSTNPNYNWLSMQGVYHPNLLDDPELIAGKHSTLLVFPSYLTSVIDYVKPSDLKKDLNDKFRERFPHIQLTLSKLRSLKKEMFKISRTECNIDLSIIAQAFVYFEKLILKVLVNKQNRKLCAGACLLLSAKLNDVRGNELQNLVEKIETVFRVNRKDLMCLEFGVLVALDFSLLLSTTEILPHYQRLLYES